MPSEARRIQRALTVELLAKRRLNIPAIWLKPESAAANPDDAVQESHKLNTALDDWASPNDDRNLAVRLVDDHVELQIASPDDVWVRHFFQACASLRIDARFAYGTRSRISSIVIHADRPERWGDRWPRGHKDKAGQWVETKIAFSTAATKTAKPVFVHSRPLPGSTFAGDLVVWRPSGKSAADDGELGLEDLEPRELATTSMESICRAVSFATLAYWITVYLDGLTDWDQSLTRTIGGWIARQVREGRDINARGKSLEGVCWAPVDSSDTAALLLNFLGNLGAGRELRVAFDHADSALERNQPVPGWPSLESLFGPVARIGIRRAFRAGLDIDVIEEMSGNLIYDTGQNLIIDRDKLLKGNGYAFDHDHLVRQWENQPVFIGLKKLNPFRLYMGSSLRTDVDQTEFLPGAEPGSIRRISPVYGLLDHEEHRADEYTVLNTFHGFHIKPIGTVDPAIMGAAVTMLDRMLGLLTRDNDAQILWLKKFLAWIVQHPEIKSQVCPIIIGGQGIGKSVFGDNLMSALFDTMAGTADAASLHDNKFFVAPFVGKLITFVDEVRFETASVISTIKKLIRQDRISSAMKYKDQRDHYIPSRLLLASNHIDIGLKAEDTADRTFFFILAYNAQSKGMLDRDFLTWAVTLKPFFNTVMGNLKNVVFRQHLMRYFTEIEVQREELEDLTYSSRNEEDVVRMHISENREAAREIVADARVHNNRDITAWFTIQDLREAIRRFEGTPRTKADARVVIKEYESAGVLEVMNGVWYRFKYRYVTLIKALGEAHGLPIAQRWRDQPDDYGENTVDTIEGGMTWRGGNQQNKQQSSPFWKKPDPDAMPDF